MNSKKMLIILTPGFPASEADTTCLPMQQQLVKKINELQPGLNIIIFSFQYPYHATPYSWFGIPVIPFGGRNKGGVRKLITRKKIFAKLNALNRESNIAGLFSFWYNECAFVGKKFADKNHLKHFCWILGQDAKKENKYPRLLRPLPGELVGLSDFVQNEFEKSHGVKPKWVIPPGIDEALFGSSTENKDIDILGAGSLIRLKQYDVFLGIIASVKKHLPSIRAMLVGGGPEKKNLEILVGKLDLENNVVLAGELPYQEVLKRMQRAKVFLHTSSYEGFGCVCVEALYARAQVVSFCRPLSRTIANWHIVADKEDMVSAALALLKNWRPADAHNDFPIAATARSILELFDA